MNNNRELITKSLDTILEIFTDRKIDVSNVDIDALHSIIKKNAQKIGFEIIINNTKIVYYLSNKFKFSELKEFYKDTKTLYDKNMLIVQDKISQNNLKALNSLVKNNQIFNIKELQFNISKHFLVPKHEIIDDTETKRLIEVYNLKSKLQFPLIRSDDPMARYLGMKSGEIVKITRNSPTAGTTIVYRCCL